MDIAKIRKKAKEREAKGRNAEENLPRTEGPAEPVTAVPSAAPREDEGHAGEAGHAVAGEMAVSPVAGEETVPPSLPENKEGERGFSGEKGAGAEGGMLELLTFSIGSEEFAFRVPEVEEIIRYQRITKVPTLPDYVRGITSLRGKIIPVLDLRKRLCLKGAPAEEKTFVSDGKILILEGPKGMIGAIIDRVLGVVRFEEGTILDPPGHLSEGELRFIEGVVILEKRFISIIRSYDALDIELTEGG